MILKLANKLDMIWGCDNSNSMEETLFDFSLKLLSICISDVDSTMWLIVNEVARNGNLLVFNF